MASWYVTEKQRVLIDIDMEKLSWQVSYCHLRKNAHLHNLVPLCKKIRLHRMHITCRKRSIFCLTSYNCSGRAIPQILIPLNQRGSISRGSQRKMEHLKIEKKQQEHGLEHGES